MSTLEINHEVSAKLDTVRAALGRAILGTGDVCVTCSFQAEDVLLTKLALELDPNIPVLFLDTGYHFRETYEYRDRIAREWRLNLINLLPEKTVAEQEAEHGLLYQSAPDQCCKLRKVSRFSKPSHSIASGSLDFAASRPAAAPSWKNPQCSPFPAASRC